MGDKIPGVGKRISRFAAIPMGLQCARFDVLHWARGCPGGCSYCFLNRTFRRLPAGKAWHQYDAHEVAMHLRAWLLRDPEDGEPTVLNAGELCDSFGVSTAPGTLAVYARMFEDPECNPHGRTLLLVTKRASARDVGLFMEAMALEGPAHPPAHVVFSMTLNAQQFRDRYEVNTPTMVERLATLWAAQKLGMRIRVRIDPVWHQYDYTWLCDRVRELKPEAVTLGSFRLYTQDASWFPRDRWLEVWGSLGGADVDGRMRPQLRLHAYMDISDMLRGVPVALCKEPTGLVGVWWERTGRGPTRCNCMP